MQDRTRRSFIGGAAALVLGALGWLLFWPDPLAVTTATVARRPLAVTIEEQGRTRARDPFVVAAPVGGRLLRPALEAGMHVAEGEVVARIAVPQDDPRAAAITRADLQAAEARERAAAAALAEAEGAEARARRERERREELAKTGVSTAEEVDFYRQAATAAAARLDSTRAAREAAAAEVARARSLLLGSQPADAAVLGVPAPASGTVYRVYEENERVVAAGTPLYSLGRDDALEIVVDLLTQDAVQVRAGQRMLLTGWGGSAALEASVLRVEPEAFTKVSALGVEEQRVNVIGTPAAVPAGLGAEYRVDVGIVVAADEDVLTVPSSAVFQHDGHWQVFVVEAGRARLVTFRAGRRNRDYLQVEEGLAEGAEVILFPSDLVVDGVRVAPASP